MGVTIELDAAHGTRNAKGDWAPNELIEYPKVFVWPPKPAGFAKWLFGWPGYLWPWNLLYALVALGVWFWATPSIATMSDLSPGWIALVLLRNLALVLVWYGAWHLRLYVKRTQGNQFKFKGSWPSSKSSLFSFGSQLKDNMFWSLASGVPIWTAWEVLTLWLFANGNIPWLAWSDNPVWFVAWMLLIPLFRDIHFYAVHRLIHVSWLYKPVHSLHHRNTSPGPWSGLAMHPIEHLVYFSAVLIHWIVPSHPIHATFTMIHLGMAPVPGHSGFDKVVLGERAAVDTGSYAHYLHHKLFEVNYADGAIPLDKWFGSFHDGSPAADEALKKRRVARRLAQTSDAA
jgi:sterol desaturase/sphingolipid hydroxylase (fatty acid hydroxylase superfamily)